MKHKRKGKIRPGKGKRRKKRNENKRKKKDEKEKKNERKKKDENDDKDESEEKTTQNELYSCQDELSPVSLLFDLLSCSTEKLSAIKPGLSP